MRILLEAIYSFRTNEVLYIWRLLFLRMVGTEPQLFKDWGPYMKIRQTMIASAVFNSNGWMDWQPGHAKLFSVFIWLLKTKRTSKFKYSKSLMKLGYRRTQNYKLLNEIIEQEIIEKHGKGYYSIPADNIELISKTCDIIKEIDKLQKTEEKNDMEAGWQNTV